MTSAITSIGLVVSIGQGDAATVVPASDTFDPIEEVTDMSGPGGEANVIDASSFDSTRVEKLMGLADEGQLTLSVNYIPQATGQASAFAARAAQQLRNIRITMTDAGAEQFDFTGYVIGFSHSASVNDKVNAEITIEITGAVTKTT